MRGKIGIVLLICGMVLASIPLSGEVCGSITGYQYITEAESIQGVPINIVTDLEASGNSGISPFLDANGRFSLLNWQKYIPNSGEYQIYLRCRDSSQSTIRICISDQAQNEHIESFVVKDYHDWYLSTPFSIQSGQISFNFYSSSSSLVLDKIIIIQIKQSGQWTDIPFGQYIDTPTGDLDEDGLLNNAEGGNGIWWFEAENIRNLNYEVITPPSNIPATMILDQIEASNSKCVTSSFGITTETPIIDSSFLPSFSSETNYKIYIRARGSSYFLIELKDSSNTYIQKGDVTKYVSNQFQWFSTPYVSTIGMNSNLKLQIYIPPPSEGSVYIDKILIINTNPIKKIGQISDPLSIDTDIDGLIDKEETGLFIFEGEDFACNTPIFNIIQTPKIDGSNQIKWMDKDASNGASIKPDANNAYVDLNSHAYGTNILQHNTKYNILVRAKKGISSSDTTITISDGVSLSDTYKLNHSYKWYKSSIFRYDSVVTNIQITESFGNGDSFVDKIIISPVSNSMTYNLSDILDSDTDRDYINDGKERNKFTHHFEAESHKSINSMKYFQHSNQYEEISDISNSTCIYSDNNVEMIDFNSIPNFDQGHYEIWISSFILGSSQGNEKIKISTSTLPVTSFSISIFNNWYKTPIFYHYTGPIQLSIKPEYNPNPLGKVILDSFIIRKMKYADNSLIPETNGQLPINCIISDFDQDNWTDGYEIPDTIYWFECEDWALNQNYIISDNKGYNTYSASKDTGFEKIIQILKFLPQGDYKFGIRAKTHSYGPTNLLVNFYYENKHFKESVIELSYDYCWYIIDLEVANEIQLVFDATMENVQGTVYLDSAIIYSSVGYRQFGVGEIIRSSDHIFEFHYNFGSCPYMMNSDNDNIIDSIEYYLGTSPFTEDSDQDNIDDSMELNFGLNPTLADTDGDNIPDGWLDGWGFDKSSKTYCFNEKDGLENVGWNSENNFCFLEYEKLTYNVQFARDEFNYYTETDPIEKDTDLDGLNDDLEYIYHGSPFDGDTDDDGLSDSYEYTNFKQGLNDHDIDNDGLPDGLEKSVTISTKVPEKDVDDYGGADVRGTNVDSDNFEPDTDTDTSTDPLNYDSDGDLIPDGWIDGYAYNNRNGEPNIFIIGSLDEIPTAYFNSNGIIYMEGEDLNKNGKHDSSSGESDPTESDTDSGGQNDFYERLNNLNVNLPSDDDDLDDDDNDGLINAIEESINSNKDYADSDFDGLSDFVEYFIIDPLSVTRPDFDGDGVIDSREGDSDSTNPNKWKENSDYKYIDSNNGINAMDIDSDDDGLKDNEEAIVISRTNSIRFSNSNNFDYHVTNTWIFFLYEESSTSDYKSYQYSGITSYSSTDEIVGKSVDGFDILKSSSTQVYINNQDTNKPLFTIISDPESFGVCEDSTISYDYLTREEIRFITDPTDIDTDGDGLTDYIELFPDLDILISDPNDPDTDNDQINDNIERRLFNEANTEDKAKYIKGPLPWLPSTDDSTIDSDCDGINNYQEEFDPNYEYLNEKRTKWWHPDTDRDGLLDGWEYKYGKDYNDLLVNLPTEARLEKEWTFLNPTERYSHGSESLDFHDGARDTEIYFNDYSIFWTPGDGLTNLKEQESGGSPFSYDTDGDGFLDIEEFYAGSDANSINSGTYDIDGDQIFDWEDSDIDGDEIPNPSEIGGVSLTGYSGSTYPNPINSEVVTNWNGNSNNFDIILISPPFENLYCKTSTPFTAYIDKSTYEYNSNYQEIEFLWVLEKKNTNNIFEDYDLDSVESGIQNQMLGNCISICFKNEGEYKLTVFAKDTGGLKTSHTFDFEVTYLKTNPMSKDTDKDGITDGDEFLVYGTNPLQLDTDMDGVRDNTELIQNTNPVIGSENNLDSDSDGLNDFFEKYVTSTNINSEDTDNDFYSDFDEYLWETDPNNGFSNNVDTDSDRINDYTEIHDGIDDTNPNEIELHLNICYDETIDSSFLSTIQTSLTYLDNHLSEMTDGIITLGIVTLYEESDPIIWDSLDVLDLKLFDHSTYPLDPENDPLGHKAYGEGSYFNYASNQDAWDCMNMPTSYYKDYANNVVLTIGDGNWERTLAHEIGHYAFGLADEYKDANNRNYYNSYDGPTSVMNSQSETLEMSDLWSWLEWLYDYRDWDPAPESWWTYGSEDTYEYDIPMQEGQRGDWEPFCWVWFWKWIAVNNHANVFDINNDGIIDEMPPFYHRTTTGQTGDGYHIDTSNLDL